VIVPASSAIVVRPGAFLAIIVAGALAASVATA